MAGDSSADEYENILIGEMTTDNEDMETDVSNVKGFKFRSAIDESAEKESEPILLLPITS